MSILIENVFYNGREVNIHIEEKRISYIGHQKMNADMIISGKNKSVFPTLVNAHTHAAMTLFRGYGDDMPLREWLETKIWPAEAALTEEDVYWGTKLACLEMIKSGTTLFNDMYWHFHGTAKAVEEMGIRAVISAVFIDFFQKNVAEQQKQANETLFRESRKYSDRIQFAFGPHAIYTVSGESLQWIKEFADRENIPIHIHLSETEQEVKDCLNQNGVPPVEYLKSLGFLGKNVFACHGVWLSDSELDILSQYGVTLVHNPISNLKLATGKIFRYPEIKRRNIPVCIGTDGCASNNNLDMLESIKFASLLQKWNSNDPTALPCHEIWDLSTTKAHLRLGVDAGEIKEGKLADLMLVDMNNIQMVPNHDPISNLVYSANGSVIDTVICDGKVLMKDREIPGEMEIIHKASEVADKITHKKKSL